MGQKLTEVQSLDNLMEWALLLLVFFCADPDSPLEVEKSELHCLIGKNFLITLHDGSPEILRFIQEFRSKLMRYDQAFSGHGPLSTFSWLWDEAFNINVTAAKNIARTLTETLQALKENKLPALEARKIFLLASDSIGKMGLEIDLLSRLSDLLLQLNLLYGERGVSLCDNTGLETTEDCLDLEQDVFNAKGELMSLFQRDEARRVWEGRVFALSAGMKRLGQQLNAIDSELQHRSTNWNTLVSKHLAGIGTIVGLLGGYKIIVEELIRYGAPLAIQGGLLGATLLASAVVGGYALKRNKHGF